MSGPGDGSTGGGRLVDVSAALLVGGASSRMGRDKARLLLGGAPAASRLARGLAMLFEDVMLVGGDPPADAPGRRVPDPPGPPGALRGLVGAFDAARTPRVLVVATDLLGLTPDLVLGLVAAGDADAVVPRQGGRLHPLCALYRCEAVAPAARRCLEEGRLAVAGVLEGVAVHVIEGRDLAALDPEGLVLANVNTPEDLRAFEARVGGAGEGAW